ncbi:MAG: Translation initiation factor IF-3 [candidate division TM6 bacterium GW2011_GWF2_43_17]|nr:MAG: Translation initiation factor IF-3 [candidate division TM6 bacterium GW2011_GWF2_43_17]HAU30392.1 translation initiation factor IF-3 [Candidatus Dependentiae bacterium]
MIGKEKRDLPLANERIRFDKMQLIDQDGENRGVISRSEALSIARSAQLDLVLIAERGGAGFPVVKVMDLGKMLYEKKKQVNEAKKKQHVIQVKELKMRPKIADHDFLTKMKRAVEFLQEGKHVKVTLVFRGREATMKDEVGREFFQRIMDVISSADYNGRTVAQESDSHAGSLWSRVFVLRK